LAFVRGLDRGFPFRLAFGLCLIPESLRASGANGARVAGVVTLAALEVFASTVVDAAVVVVVETSSTDVSFLATASSTILSPWGKADADRTKKASAMTRGFIF
jgi:hypothetical protein